MPWCYLSPTQKNKERQCHDRLDIDEIAAVTICTARLGPVFASEMGKRWRVHVCRCRTHVGDSKPGREGWRRGSSGLVCEGEKKGSRILCG